VLYFGPGCNKELSPKTVAERRRQRPEGFDDCATRSTVPVKLGLHLSSPTLTFPGKAPLFIAVREFEATAAASVPEVPLQKLLSAMSVYAGASDGESDADGAAVDAADEADEEDAFAFGAGAPSAFPDECGQDMDAQTSSDSEADGNHDFEKALVALPAGWSYVRFKDLGCIVYDEAGTHMNAHCGRCACKCHLDRTITPSDNPDRAGNQRPLGMLLAWLLLCDSDGYKGKCWHSSRKRWIGSEAARHLRLAARESVEDDASFGAVRLKEALPEAAGGWEPLVARYP
jgi:hypothetical protein